MPQKKSLPAFLLLFLLLPFASKASHIYGGDFSYAWISGNTYKLTLSLYGDCTGMSFPQFQVSVPQIRIYNYQVSTTNAVQSVNLSINAPATGVEVTPVCNAYQNATSCTNASSTIPGVKRFIYTANVTLSGISTDWRFRFEGQMGGQGGQAGRSNTIGNIQFVNNASLMTLEASLNNATGHNSSPQFTTIPTPFYCNNITQQYNQGAVDPDNDSLGYALAPALDPNGAVNYVPGYTATNPLSTSAPMTLNPVTGQISFTPNAVQRSVVVNKVYEYRNGAAVGFAMREMTFVILATCSSAPPTGPIDTAANNTTGGGALSSTEFISCYGAATQIHFQVKPTDPDGDTVNVTVNGLPAGATAVISNNNTTAPTIDVNWNTTNLAPGAYSFFVTYKDFGCPLSNQQTIAYTLYVVRPNQLVSSPVIARTNCVHKAAVQYNTAYGLLPRTISVSQGGAVLHTLSDNTGSTIDSLSPGTYNISISSPHLNCVSQYTLTVVDSGIYPFKPVVAPVFYCLNDAAVPLTATPNAGAVIHWYSPAGTALPAAPTPSTATAGIFNYLVSQRYLVCESLQDTAKVYVTQRPVAAIAAPAAVCTHDTAVISFNGTIGVGPIIGYTWGFDSPDYEAGSGAGPYSINWATPGTRRVSLQVFENQCPSFPDTVDVLVKRSPQAVFTAPAEACRLDTISAQYNIPALAGLTYTWGFDGADVASGSGRGPYLFSYAGAGIKHLTLLVDLAGCTDTASRNVQIHETPATSITNTPGTVCLADKIYLLASSNVPATYTWTPQDRIFTDPDGAVFTRVMEPTAYTVYAHSEYGCADSAKLTYTDVAPCCNFSYPNAFSPNGDGHNDTYKVITYGNDQSYEFSIYDRWGHRVFYTFDSRLGWDGTYGGKPCATGTYFYYLKARCYTGHNELTKGDFELLR